MAIKQYKSFVPVRSLTHAELSLVLMFLRSFFCVYCFWTQRRSYRLLVAAFGRLEMASRQSWLEPYEAAALGDDYELLLSVLSSAQVEYWRFPILRAWTQLRAHLYVIGMF